MRLVVVTKDVEGVEVTYRNGFHVVAPVSLAETQRDRAVEAALSDWMKTRVRSDAETFIRRHAPRLGVEPGGLRVKDQRHLWGSCGADGVINLNWELVFLPKTVLEYAVVHELSHLRHRNHSAAFWAMVRSALPECEASVRILDRSGLARGL